MNFLAALGLTVLGFILLGIRFLVEYFGRVRFGGRLSGLPYIVILMGVFYMGASIWTGISSLFDTSSPTPIPTLTPRRSYTSTPNTTSSTQQTRQASNCIDWTEVTAAMIGNEKCVYGNVYKTRFVGESTFQILFSSNPQAFFLAGGTYNYNITSGNCVFAEGVVLKSGAGVPYIDIDEGLYQCESWME